MNLQLPFKCRRQIKHLSVAGHDRPVPAELGQLQNDKWAFTVVLTLPSFTFLAPLFFRYFGL